MKSQERLESLLMTIDTLGMCKIKHLQQIHDLKSYRNACRVVKQLSPYLHEVFHAKEKVVYLNKEGRDLIGSKKERKANTLIEHTLLANEAYLHFNCPLDWKREYVLEEKPKSSIKGLHIGGLKLASKKVIADAAFTRNDYLYLIEIDNTRKMIDNRKKIKTYLEMLRPSHKLIIFTTTEDRKRKFEGMLKGRGEVLIFKGKNINSGAEKTTPPNRPTIAPPMK